MQRLKGKSSRKLMQEYSHLRKLCWGRHLRARGFFMAISGNVTDEVIMEYVRTQERAKGDGGRPVAGEVAGYEGGEAPGPDLLHVLAAMPAKCLPAALRVHGAGLARAAGGRKPPIVPGGGRPTTCGAVAPGKRATATSAAIHRAKSCDPARTSRPAPASLLCATRRWPGRRGLGVRRR